MENQIFFPAEWHPQSAVQLTFPHADSDWAYMLPEVTACFVCIAHEIISRQQLLIVCQNTDEIRTMLHLTPEHEARLRLVEIGSNDTWARDHAGITIYRNNVPAICNFTFNGWGLKFAADKDNQITNNLFDKQIFAPEVVHLNRKNFVLEGGALESDGKGTLLTTSKCLLSPNRNSHLSKAEIEAYLKAEFGLKRILWLDHGYLAGDDTDSHIDTLARFCNEHTIAYVQCTDPYDEHFEALRLMEEQLRTFVDFEGKPYHLLPLPMAEPAFEEDERLPATYANFLIMNTAVLVPTYGTATDQKALDVLRETFPNREIVGVPCSALIRQHGSLHCVTMQYGEGVII